MARKVFFSFHYDLDNWRLSQIRECNSITQHFESSRLLDHTGWEEVLKGGRRAIKAWIDYNMYGKSVVICCFGAQTADREWVQYELRKAHEEGKGIIAVDMVGMKDRHSVESRQGRNPLSVVKVPNGWGGEVALSSLPQYKTYRWIADNGREYIDEWVEAAARAVGR